MLRNFMLISPLLIYLALSFVGVNAWRLLFTRTVVLRPEYLANLGFAFPSWPVFLVELHEVHRSVDGLLLRLQFELRVATDNLLGLGERTVDYLDLPAGKADSGALRSGRN